MGNASVKVSFWKVPDVVVIPADVKLEPAEVPTKVVAGVVVFVVFESVVGDTSDDTGMGTTVTVIASDVELTALVATAGTGDTVMVCGVIVLSVALTVVEVPASGRVKNEFNGTSVVWRPVDVAFAVEVLRLDVNVLLVIGKTVVEFAEVLLLLADVAFAVVAIGTVVILVVDGPIDARTSKVVVVDVPLSVTLVMDGVIADVMGVASTPIETLTLTETSCLR